MNNEQQLAEYKVGLGTAKLTIFRDRLFLKKLTSSKNIPIKNISHVEVKKWTKQLVLHMTGGTKEEIQLSRGNSLQEAEDLVNSLISSGGIVPTQDISADIKVENSEKTTGGVASAKGKKWFKNKWVIAGGLAILFFIFIASLGGESTPAPIMSMEQQQQVVLRIEQKIYQIEERYKPAMDKYSKAFEDLGEGRGNIFDAYAAADDARKAAENMRREYSSLCRDETPREMPREIRDSLRDVCSELSTSYFVRAQAFEAAARFVEDQRPSDFRDFEEKINSSDRFLVSAVAKLFEVKNKLGIEIVGDE